MRTSPFSFRNLATASSESAKLLAELDQSVAQPGRGPFGRFESGVELIDDVGVSHRIGELRGSLGIGPGDRNIERMGLPELA